MQVYRLSTTELNSMADELDGHECNYEDDCAKCALQLKVERELDARDLADHDDERVREAYGVYR